MQLSKSDYILFLKHPAWLWLKKHDTDKLPKVTDYQQAIFDAGNVFESYAEKLFPDGVRLGFDNYKEYESLPKRTKEAIDKGKKVLFQARFETIDLTCISDVLVKVSKNTFDLCEIKASTQPKVDHEHDLAFQKIVIEKCGYKIRKIKVIYVNREFVKKGKVDVKKLTNIADLTDKVSRRITQTESNIKEALKVMKLSKLPNLSPSLCGMSSLGKWLDIYKSLTSLDDYNIYNLCSPGIRRIKDFQDMGIEKIEDIPDDYTLSEKQKLQVLATKENRDLIDKAEIARFLNEFTYPLYFLDYETMSEVVPCFDGLSPYNQLPFQYSLHVLESPTTEIKHFEFLHSDNNNPAKAISESLKKNIGEEGTILVWNEGFEKGCNILLGNLVSEHEDFFASVNERIKDLMLPFSKGHYVHKDFFGSASLKKVLPVLVPELSYKNLGIQEGGTAQIIWMETILEGKRKNEKEKILKDLKEYCKLDTLAMVRIFEKIRQL